MNEAGLLPVFLRGLYKDPLRLFCLKTAAGLPRETKLIVWAAHDSQVLQKRFILCASVPGCSI